MLHLLIADNAVARIFQASEPNKPITEIYTFVNPAAHAHERDIVASRPGRMINRVAGVHQSLEPKTSARDHALAVWVHSLNNPLRALLHEQKNEGLIVIASPRLLAALRTALRRHVKIQGELARNLAGLSTPILDKRLRPLVKASFAKRGFGKLLYRPMVSRTSKSRTSESVP